MSDAFEGPAWPDRWILPFLREPTLWPVLLVIVAHAMAFVAPLLLDALREASVWARGTLGVLAVLTLLLLRYDVRNRRSPYLLSALALSTWGLSGLGAWAADAWGVY